MLLKFLIGPVIMLLASLAVGMHGTLLHIAVVQVSHQQPNTYRNGTPFFFPPYRNYFCSNKQKLKHSTSSSRAKSKNKFR
jgi:hypothetical protein